MQSIVTIFRKNLKKIDFVKLISSDLIRKLTEHYKNTQKQTIILNDLIESSDKEKEYLRKIVDTILFTLLEEKTYLKNDALRCLIREILVEKVVLPTINLICNPEFINRKIINLLDSKPKQRSSTNYTHAANYEEFIEIIKKNSSLNELREIMNLIDTELWNAWILNSLKKQSSTVVNELMSRDIGQYVNQLRMAKSICEKRIRGFNEDETGQESNLDRKVLAFNVIMSSEIGRSYLLKYLEKDGSDALLRFYNDINKLKSLSRSNSLQQFEYAHKIYENFIHKFNSPVKDELGKDCCRNMQLYLLGNQSIDAYYTAQNKVYMILEKEHYPRFLITKIYHELVAKFNTISGGNNNFKSQIDDSGNDQQTLGQTILTRREILLDKLNIKLQAYEAFKASQINDEENKILKILDEDINSIQKEISYLDFHEEKTKIWMNNLGNWKTQISNVDISISDSIDIDPVPHFTIQVKNDDSSEGWIIIKTLKQFHYLHKRLIELEPKLLEKYKKLPNISRSLITKTFDENEISKVKKTLDEYLKFVTNDETLSNCEDLYLFLCPNPEYLHFNSRKIDRTQSSLESVRSFSMSNLFTGSLPTNDSIKKDVYFDDPSNYLSNQSIAEPLFNFVEEIFELKDSFSFRKTIMTLVQFTYDSKINRKMREIILKYVQDEDSLVYYISLLRDSIWSYDSSKDDFELRKFSNDENFYEICGDELKKQAKEVLLRSIPDGLSKLVGEKNSKICISKLFESFQDEKLNKHLFHVSFSNFYIESS